MLPVKSQLIVLVLSVCIGIPSVNAEKLPITGDQADICKPINDEILSVLAETGYKAATFAMMFDGRSVCKNGFGYHDKHFTQPIDPDIKMRIASVGKPVAAILIKDLIEDGKLSYETKVFDYLGIEPFPGVKAFQDSRVKEITVQNLLDHKLGWDKKNDGLSKKVRKRVRTLTGEKHPSVLSISKFMIGTNLQQSPGKEYVYSNYGYALLKAIVERETSQDYVDYLAAYMSQYDVEIIRSEPPETRAPSEVWYKPEKHFPEFSFAISSIDLAKIFTHYWVNGDKRLRNNRSNVFYGSWLGTSSILRQRKDGLTYVFLANERGAIKNKQIKTRLDKVIDEVGFTNRMNSSHRSMP